MNLNIQADLHHFGNASQLKKGFCTFLFRVRTPTNGISQLILTQNLKRKKQCIWKPGQKNMTKQVDEDLSDPNQLKGTELIMKELGAQVIAESDK